MRTDDNPRVTVGNDEMLYLDMPDVERGIEFLNIFYVSLYNNVAKALSSLNCQLLRPTGMPRCPTGADGHLGIRDPAMHECSQRFSVYCTSLYIIM